MFRVTNIRPDADDTPRLSQSQSHRPFWPPPEERTLPCAAFLNIEQIVSCVRTVYALLLSTRLAWMYVPTSEARVAPRTERTRHEGTLRENLEP
jgi:hypothetical protein